MSESISLQDWVRNEGSVSAAAKKTGMKASTLAAYCRGARSPRPDVMRLLIEQLPKTVDLSLLITDRAMPHYQRKKCFRRLRSSILVNNLGKLRKVMSENSIDLVGETKTHEAIIRRWKTTNVTVGEVRSAVEKLSSMGKNPSDINLIHETIAATRREDLRALAS